MDDIKALSYFKNSAKTEFEKYINQVDDSALFKAADLIDDSVKNGGRIHVTGIGKPAHIAGYISSLMSSTGTPCYFLHGTEAVHGSCGQLRAGDIVICISNSGNTQELIVTANAIKNNGCKVIAVTGNLDSKLSALAEVTLFAGVSEEGGPLNRAPRNSILAETFIIQALTVILQERRQIDPKQYVKWHPGGSLGVLRENEVK